MSACLIQPQGETSVNPLFHINMDAGSNASTSGACTALEKRSNPR